MGELHHNGWYIELAHEPEYRAYRLLLRNPTRGMVGGCRITDEYLMMIPRRDHLPLVYLDEQLLVKAEFFREMQLPKMDVFTVDVAEPMTNPMHMVGRDDLRHEWMIYTPDNNGQDIIVTPDKVPMLLEQIVAAQEPRAKEIMASQYKRERLGSMRTTAKILTFG